MKRQPTRPGSEHVRLLVQGSPSTQKLPGTHVPAPSHTSGLVQLLPSVHGVPPGRGTPPTLHGHAPGISTFKHPLTLGSHSSAVHGLPSSQLSGPVATHVPDWHTLTEHTSAPAQLVPSGWFWNTHPLAWHVPILHVGWWLGSHGESWVHWPSRQTSSVHGLPSLAHAGP